MLQIILFGLVLFLFRRKIDVNPVNSFSGDGIDHETDSVLRDNKFSGFGEVIQMLDDVTADGIVILGFQMDSQFFIQVIQLGGT